jgi:hypothetical protein
MMPRTVHHARFDTIRDNVPDDGLLPFGNSNAPSDDPDDPLRQSTLQDTGEAGIGVTDELSLQQNIITTPYISWVVDHGNPGVIFRSFYTSMPLLVLVPLIIWASSFVVYYYFAAVRNALGMNSDNETWIMKTLKGAIISLWSHFYTGLSTTCIWAPVVLGYALHSQASKKFVMWFKIAISVLFFGLTSFGYYYVASGNNTAYEVCDWFVYNMSEIGEGPFGVAIQAWSTGTMPRAFQGCIARVAPQQAPLFTTDIYQSQFARTYYTIADQSRTCKDATGNGHQWQVHPAFNTELFRSIQSDQYLCGQGFLANIDLYGLGTRCGVYMQWISSLLANNYLSNARQEIQKVYLIFSFAICVATLIASIAKSCVFSIEIEILYWMYWGGYICVFGSAPCAIRLGSVSTWIRLDWTAAILFTTNWIMTYHGIWYILYAYDQVFSRMPCGTYQFFFAAILDPSEVYWVLRDWLTQLAIPFIPMVLIAFPTAAVLLVPEAKHALLESAAFQLLINRKAASNPGQAEVASLITESLPLRRRMYKKIKLLHRRFRETCGLPSNRRGGIRLVTPVDVDKRR